MSSDPRVHSQKRAAQPRWQNWLKTALPDSLRQVGKRRTKKQHSKRKRSTTERMRVTAEHKRATTERAHSPSARARSRPAQTHSRLAQAHPNTTRTQTRSAQTHVRPVRVHITAARGHSRSRTFAAALRRIHLPQIRLPHLTLPVFRWQDTKLMRLVRSHDQPIQATNLYRQSTDLAHRISVRLTGAEQHRCPYCLEPVKSNDPRGVTVCPICKTWHHSDCWSLTGMCQVPHGQ